MITCDIHRESSDVCRFAFYIDGERVKFDDDRVRSHMKENGIETLASLLRATTSSLPGDVIWPDYADRQAVSGGVLTQAQVMTDEQWESLNIKALIPIVKSLVRLQSADLTTIAGAMVDAALEDGRLKEAE